MSFLDFLLEISNFIWDYILIYTLIPLGIYFSIFSRFAQIRLFPKAIKLLCNKNDADGVSSLQALLVSTGVRVGTGNIAGVAVAISIGGAGAVFWMWITALFGMSLSLVENSLGQCYKIRHKDGYIGGPAFYLRDGLGGVLGKVLSICFAVSVVLCFGIGFNAIQANTVSDLLLSGRKSGDSWLVEQFGMKYAKVFLAFCLTAASFYLISGGFKRIVSFSQIIVPVMSLFYLSLAVIVAIIHIDKIPSVFANILQSAFGYGAVAGGFTGSMLRTAMMQGIRRGLFSNEAGLGSAPNIAATVETSHPVNQGIVQSLGVFIDTILVCSATAFLLLLSDAVQPGQEVAGITLVEEAMRQFFGTGGTIILSLCVFFFAYSSLVGNYYCGEANILYLSRKPYSIWGFRLIVALAVFLGASLDLSVVWGLGDLFMGLMAVINLFGILILSEKGFKLIQDFERQKTSVPIFHLGNIEEVPQQTNPLRQGIWQ